jgi:transposase
LVLDLDRNSTRSCRSCLCIVAKPSKQGLKTLNFLEEQIKSAEKRLEAIMKVSAEADLLKTLPCFGKILSMVLMLEIGRVDRFPTAAHLASYAGLVPRVRS